MCYAFSVVSLCGKTAVLRASVSYFLTCHFIVEVVANHNHGRVTRSVIGQGDEIVVKFFSHSYSPGQSSNRGNWSTNLNKPIKLCGSRWQLVHLTGQVYCLGHH